MGGDKSSVLDLPASCLVLFKLHYLVIPDRQSSLWNEADLVRVSALSLYLWN